MTIVRKNGTFDGANPAGWSAPGATGSNWIGINLRDYPDSANTYVNATTTAQMYTDHYTAPGSEFSIPTDATVVAVRVRIEAKKNTASSCALRGKIYIAGVWRTAATQSPSTTKAEYVYEWTTNPVTGAAWTPTQINSHAATNGITYFGWEATDVSSDYNVYSFVLEVEYTPAASSDFSGSITLDDSVAAGSFLAGSSAFAGAVALDDSAVTGSFAAQPGVITSQPLKTNNGTLLASVALSYVAVYNASTGALVVRQTGLSTGGDGRFSVSSASIVPGTQYRVDWETAAGERRMPLAVAA